MAIENANEVKEWLGKEENKGFLKENGFQTEIEVEKKVEVHAQLSDDVVKNYIEGNQGLKDKMYNNNVTEFLKKRTGKEEIKPEDLGAKLLFENDVNTQNEKYKNALIKANMAGVKNSELLIGQIDSSKINFNDGKLEGFDDQYAALKTKYPDMFETKPRDTPPAGRGNQQVDLTYEQFEAMTPEERRGVSDETLDKLMK